MYVRGIEENWRNNTGILHSMVMVTRHGDGAVDTAFSDLCVSTWSNGRAETNYQPNSPSRQLRRSATNSNKKYSLVALYQTRQTKKTRLSPSCLFFFDRSTLPGVVPSFSLSPSPSWWWRRLQLMPSNRRQGHLLRRRSQFTEQWRRRRQHPILSSVQWRKKRPNHPR